MENTMEHEVETAVGVMEGSCRNESNAKQHGTTCSKLQPFNAA